MSPVAELRSPRLSYRLSPVPAPRYICHSVHKHTSMQYNAYASLFCEANFIVTPLGLPFYHCPTELWHVQQGLAAVCEHVQTSAVQICRLINK